ncbi:LuxR C-terminal-related transcriptional regulator [Paracrocinitomix mangrovi]|uniref:tetratricopeptide repeat protein n=1 Tax=Paracrocinitomix mangrovi TaxID=2862509 RepID=UPI001C8ED76E|nr:LuxR C-terminal-related transcriptional regulator [Paracrocinitomix mangrovi]UKN00465.1 LuxR C-terminal-related transcriptional regulator [Paracrocinitomix mangrovi]
MNEITETGDLNASSRLECLQIYEDGIQLVDTLSPLSEARAYLYFNYSKFLHKIGDVDEALRYGLLVNEIVEDPDYKGEKYYIYNELGKVYIKLGDPEKAVEIEKHGLNLKIEESKVSGNQDYHYLFNELGLTYFGIGQYDSAIHYYNKAIYSDFPFNNHFNFVLLENKAEALIKNGAISEARIVIDTLKNHAGRFDQQRRNINYYLLESELYLAKGNLQLSGNYLKLAYDSLVVSKERYEHNIWRRYLNNNNHYYTLLGDPHLLSKNELKLSQFEDSLDVIKERMVAQSRSVHLDQIIQNQQLIEEQHLSVLKQEKLENKNKSLLLIVAVLGILVLMILGTLVYRAYSLKKKMNRELSKELGDTIDLKDELKETLKYKEGDIQSLHHHLSESSEQVQKLKETLKRINNTTDLKEKERILMDFMIDVRQNIWTLESNEEMLSQIDQINEKFKNSLLQKYPDLTKGELQYCCFIKAGLSNADIAAKKNTSLNTVKTAKHRLKKKLELDKSDSLENFILSW